MAASIVHDIALVLGAARFCFVFLLCCRVVTVCLITGVLFVRRWMMDQAKTLQTILTL